MAQTYGLFSLIDLGILNPAAPASTTRADMLISAILYDQAQHNRDIAAITGTFCETTTTGSLLFQTNGTGRNQPLDEFGRSIPIQPTPPYTVGFPLIGSGAARGANFLTDRLMTNGELARALSQMYLGDYNWVSDQILGALFNNASYTFTDRLPQPGAPAGLGALTVYGPANGDATVYSRANAQTASTDTHFFAEADPISDASNPFPDIQSELEEHPVNGGSVITLAATNLRTSIEGLTGFYPVLDPAIQLGTGTARLGNTPALTLPIGAELIGKMDAGPWVYVWSKMPAGYMISMTTNGRKPLARRVFAQADLQGFQPAGVRRDFPYFEDQWIRFEGYGSLNRVGVVVNYRGVSDTYAVPTNYGVPMA